MIKLKATIISMGMVLSVLVFTPLHAEAEPTLKQTMNWLTDYLVRESGCTYDGDTTIAITGASYDATGQYFIIKEDRRVLSEKPDDLVTKRIPLYAITKVETIFRENAGCAYVKIDTAKKDIKIDDDLYLSSSKLRFFRTKEAAERVSKALRHAMKLSHKPHRNELF
ncbi:MAG: hypothetical protein COB41_06935 [Proteobacteria bacterium]|nr:MAG: hypothetical protein COB41_06935 [Pseudomonadota bacterium]